MQTQTKSAEQEQEDRLALLFRTASERGIGSFLILDGNDLLSARRVISELAQVLDPRHYEIMVPSKNLSAPFLLPYWQNVPKYGNAVIYRQSYYGNLALSSVTKKSIRKRMTERVYEIGDFERTLSRDRYMFFKVFIHNDANEIEESYKKHVRKTSLRDILRSEIKRILEHYEDFNDCFSQIRELTDRPLTPWLQARARKSANHSIFNYMIAKWEERLEIDSLKAVQNFDLAMDKVRSLRGDHAR